MGRSSINRKQTSGLPQNGSGGLFLFTLGLPAGNCPPVRVQTDQKKHERRKEW